MIYQPGEGTPIIPHRRRWLATARDWLQTALTIGVIVVGMNLLFPRYYVEGQSMEPGLHENDRLFVSNLDVLAGQVPRGTLVVFTSPYDGERAVKRIIGLPGEHIEINAGVVYVDGVRLDEPYTREAPRYSGNWLVGPDEYFVLGDNRNRSLDSGDYGPITADRIQGVVKFRYLPLDQISGFSIPDYAQLKPGS
jgi:signal peptidase I